MKMKKEEKTFDLGTRLLKDEQENSVFDQQVINKYGKPYYLNEKTKSVSTINQSYWAGLYMLENILLYESLERRFYRYAEQTGLYEELTDDAIKQEISSRILQVAVDEEINGLESKRSINTLTSIVSHLKGIAEIQNTFAYKKRNFIHLKNGVLDILDGGTVNLVSFSPTFYSRNQSPLKFEPHAKCETFLNDFLNPAVSQEDALIIQKYAGICLLGNNIIQRLLILVGLEGRGKSQLSIIFQELVGLLNVTELRTQHLSERFEIYRYSKKTLLSGVDVPGNFLNQKGGYLLKGLVGGDLFDAEKKGCGDSFHIKGNFCILITANSKLKIQLDGDHGAWRRRLLIVNYHAPPPKKKIPDLGKILIQKEGSGILNWALEGLKMLWDEIEASGDIVLGDEQNKRIDDLLAESDSVRHFLKDKVIEEQNSDVTVAEIEEGYATYCPEMGWNPKHITQIRRELDGLILELFKKTKSHSISRYGKTLRGFRGLKIQ